MPRGLTIKQLRKTGAFAAGELAAGQLGVNVSDRRLEFSVDGALVDTAGGKTILHTLTWNSASALANKYEPNPRPVLGYYRYVGPTDPTTLGVTLKNGDTWEQTF